eukprot:1992909-Amphidinium_carterae.1
MQMELHIRDNSLQTLDDGQVQRIKVGSISLPKLKMSREFFCREGRSVVSPLEAEEAQEQHSAMLRGQKSLGGTVLHEDVVAAT